MEELNKIFRNILLSKSHIIARYTVNRNDPILQQKYFEEVLDKELNAGLVKELSKSIGYTKTENDWNITYEKEIVAFSVKDFKTMIEACVQNLSQEQIDRIKNGY